MRNTGIHETIDDVEASMNLDKTLQAPTTNMMAASIFSINEGAALRHAGEVIPGLWVGDIRSVSYIDDLVQMSRDRCSGPDQNVRERGRDVRITVISIMSNKNLINFVADLLEQKQKYYLDKQQLQNEEQREHGEVKKSGSTSMKDKCYKNENVKHENNDSAGEKAGDSIHYTGQISSTANHMKVHHITVPLRDSIDADLLGVLNETSNRIDEALGKFSLQSTPKKNETNIGAASTGDEEANLCLVHCAKGASRSVSVVIGYLLSRYPSIFQSFTDALEHVRKVRPQAMPNVKFAIDLRKYARDKSSFLNDT